MVKGYTVVSVIIGYIAWCLYDLPVHMLVPTVYIIKSLQYSGCMAAEYIRSRV